MDKYKSRQTIANAGFFSTFITITKSGKKRPSIRFYRYCSMVLIHLLFVLSFIADIQIIEGDITGSRMVGFHLADPFITAQITLSRGELPINLLIGAFTILAFYIFFAGRAFCSWVCPYNFFSEFAERLNAKLISKKIIKKREFDTKIRYIFLLFFAILSLVSGYLIFEIFNVVGIVSRFIIYGYSAAIWWVILVFLAEVFFSRRFWCRYICPIGTLYSLLSRFRAIKVSWDKNRCDHCAVCMDVCITPKVLEITKAKNIDKPNDKFSIVSGDCTMCGRCIDVCHQDALSYDNMLKKLL
ncbi:MULTISPECIES: NapH/MauN family ferredoxin-type protein [Campylobacter]|uniref:Menaquinol dehydrogenase NosGH, membrane component NosH n=1 Tax=Campylobacter porcelli TaxID=1660073 RepID=A0A1X9SXS5_9BACT|nr:MULTISPECIES: NapH/MauN family ferredoxin-type protein [unclassified Campylobacter]MCR8679345.1 NapH/MauN family ferredoxin-type protein [Campylobacter sp. RM19072]MCR8696549.1 NapH/MauN family ferredoxin-type protein [Campylobacter sp. RM19073]MEE3705223.1 NapH/MauN family ferredoxin-type protein [Campylobacter sp. CX2-8023-23]MEE3744891.1 NapH/MauN family ferredoxin-type protein [Campylobacter sp. CX2-4855-23]MEE3777249.1 NapH/MauN family ferredoxin-type protein [Campylobacter sp. CX2-408